MLISIVIPTLNRLEFLKRAIKSVRDQTNKEYEIIVADNASTDGTKEWLETQNDINLVRQNSVLTALKNWNTAFKRANGDFLVLLSDDDLLDPDCIERIQTVSNPSQYSLIIGRHDIIDENDKITFLEDDFNHIKSGVYQPRDGLSLFARGIDFRLCTIFFNRKLLLQVDIDSLAEKFKITAADSEMIQRVVTYAPLYILDLKESIGKYRIWNKSETNQKIFSSLWHDEINLWMSDFECYAKGLLTPKEIKDAVYRVKFSNLAFAITTYRKLTKKTMRKSFYLAGKIIILLFSHLSLINLLRTGKCILLLV